MIPEISRLNIECHKAVIDFVLDGDLSLSSKIIFTDRFCERFNVSFERAYKFLEQFIDAQEEFK